MSAGENVDAARANTDEFFGAGGSAAGDRPAGELVWNPLTGTFDTVPVQRNATGQARPGHPDPRFAVMTLVADTGMFASIGDDLDYDETTGTFSRVADATDVPYEAAESVATTEPTEADRTAVADDEVIEVDPLPPAPAPARRAAPRGQRFAVMMLVAEEGHFATPYVSRAQRLRAERQRLEEYYNKGDAMILEFDDTRALFSYKSLYVVTLIIPPGFPNEMPRIYITDPPDLCRQNGQPLPERSAADHTLKRDPNFGIQVCHSSTTAWRPENSLTSVVYKAFMWIEAYEHHLGSGRSIDSYLRHQDQPAPHQAVAARA